MKQLEQEMQEVIKKNLPAHVGDALKERLEQATKIEQDNKTLLDQVEKLKTSVTNTEAKYNACNVELIALKAKESELQKKETNLFTKEKQLEIREIRVLNEITKKESAEKSVADLKEVIGIVFKNPTVQKSAFESQTGQWNWNSQTNRNEFTPDGNKSVNSSETIS